MAPLTAEELPKHPEYEHTIWKLKPDQQGKVAAAKDRGGPINIAYEVHGHGDRKIVVSTQIFNVVALEASSVRLLSLPDLCTRCGKRLLVKFCYGRIDCLSFQPHVSSCQAYFHNKPSPFSSAYFRTRRTCCMKATHFSALFLTRCTPSR